MKFLILARDEFHFVAASISVLPITQSVPDPFTRVVGPLKNWGRHKMVNILQTTF